MSDTVDVSALTWREADLLRAVALYLTAGLTPPTPKAAPASMGGPLNYRLAGRLADGGAPR